MDRTGGCCSQFPILMSEHLCNEHQGSEHIVLTSSEIVTGHSVLTRLEHSLFCSGVEYPTILEEEEDYVAIISAHVEYLMMEQSYKTVMIRIKSSVQSSHRLQSR